MPRPPPLRRDPRPLRTDRSAAGDRPTSASCMAAAGARRGRRQLFPAPSALSRETLFDLDDFTASGDEITAVDDSGRRDSASGSRDIAGATVEAVARELERQLALVAESADPRRAAPAARRGVGRRPHRCRAARRRAAVGSRGARGRARAGSSARGRSRGSSRRGWSSSPRRCARRSTRPSVNLDSQVDLLRALRRAGIQVGSTSRWELREHEHPAIEPLIAYKKLARLLSANGWAWLDEWVHDGRFRPDYVPGRHRDRALGDVGRRRAPAPEERAQRGGRRSRLDPRRRRRGTARAAGARRHGARRGDGRGRPWSRPLPRHRRRGRRRRPAIRRRSRSSVRCTARRPATAAGSCRGWRGRTHARWRSSTGLRATASAGRAVTTLLGARRRCRRPSGGDGAGAGEPARRHGGRRAARAVGRRATGAGSRATSSCRAAPPSGRSAGWRRSAAALARSASTSGRPRPTRRVRVPCSARIAAPRLLPARRDHRAHAARARRRGRRGGRGDGAGCRPPAVRRLPGRLPARPGDRRQLRDRPTEPESATCGRRRVGGPRRRPLPVGAKARYAGRCAAPSDVEPVERGVCAGDVPRMTASRVEARTRPSARPARGRRSAPGSDSARPRRMPRRVAPSSARVRRRSTASASQSGQRRGRSSTRSTVSSHGSVPAASAPLEPRRRRRRARLRSADAGAARRRWCRPARRGPASSRRSSVA